MGGCWCQTSWRCEQCEPESVDMKVALRTSALVCGWECCGCWWVRELGKLINAKKWSANNGSQSALLRLRPSQTLLSIRRPFSGRGESTEGERQPFFLLSICAVTYATIIRFVHKTRNFLAMDQSSIPLAPWLGTRPHPSLILCTSLGNSWLLCQSTWFDSWPVGGCGWRPVWVSNAKRLTLGVHFSSQKSKPRRERGTRLIGAKGENLKSVAHNRVIFSQQTTNNRVRSLCGFQTKCIQEYLPGKSSHWSGSGSHHSKRKERKERRGEEHSPGVLSWCKQRVWFVHIQGSRSRVCCKVQGIHKARDKKAKNENSQGLDAGY